MLTAEALDDCRSCICDASRRAARALTREFERHLRPEGIRIGQFSLLVLLQLGGPRTVGELAAQSAIERTTLTRNLARMQAEGWIEIESGEEDARERRVAIARKGRAVLERALPRWRAAQAEAQRAMPPEALRAIALLAASPPP